MNRELLLPPTMGSAHFPAFSRSPPQQSGHALRDGRTLRDSPEACAGTAHGAAPSALLRGAARSADWPSTFSLASSGGPRYDARMDAKGFVEALRKVLVETLVPEIRELRAETSQRFEALQREMDQRFDAQLKEIHNLSQSVAHLAGQMDVLRRDILAKLDVQKEIAQLKGDLSALQGQVTVLLQQKRSA